jgi:hypothetical protein
MESSYSVTSSTSASWAPAEQLGDPGGTGGVTMLDVGEAGLPRSSPVAVEDHADVSWVVCPAVSSAAVQVVRSANGAVVVPPNSTDVRLESALPEAPKATHAEPTPRPKPPTPWPVHKGRMFIAHRAANSNPTVASGSTNEHQSQTIRLDQNRRPDPRLPRCLRQPN